MRGTQSYQFENSAANSGAAASAWFSRPISPLLAQTSVRTASKSGSLLTLTIITQKNNNPRRRCSSLLPWFGLGSLGFYSISLLFSPLPSSLLHSVSPFSTPHSGGKLAALTELTSGQNIQNKILIKMQFTLTEMNCVSVIKMSVIYNKRMQQASNFKHSCLHTCTVLCQVIVAQLA